MLDSPIRRRPTFQVPAFICLASRAFWGTLRIGFEHRSNSADDERRTEGSRAVFLAIFLVVLALLVGGGVLFTIFRLVNRLPRDDVGDDVSDDGESGDG